MPRRRVGVTGARGFLGGAVATALADAGHEVRRLDLRSAPVGEAGDEPAARSGSLDWVLHFAARTSIAASFDDPTGTFRANLEATRRALDWAGRAGAAFLQMSSYVYGVPERTPIDEEHPTAATNPYMASKLACESLCAQLAPWLGVPLVVLRGFSIYGPGGPPGRLIPDLLGAVRRGEPLRLNDPAPRRDHLYV